MVLHKTLLPFAAQAVLQVCTPMPFPLPQALGANFSGVTSAILSFFPDTARSLRLDTIYPIQGFQRWRDEAAGFELVFPSAWSADLSVRRRLAEDASWQRPSPGLPPLGLAPR